MHVELQHCLTLSANPNFCWEILVQMSISNIHVLVTVFVASPSPESLKPFTIIPPQCCEADPQNLCYFSTPEL